MGIFKIFTSSIGKKWLVALTGIYFIIFIIIHLLGNLQIFSGPEVTNQYAEMLKSFPKILWSLRLSLIAALAIHVWATISLTAHNKAARAEKYIIKKSRKASISSKTMLVSGLTLLVFILYHLSHFTLGIIDPEFLRLTDNEGRHNVYNMMILGFSHPVVSLFYIISMGSLAFHLSHGFSSAARTLGVSNKNLFENIKIFGQFFAIAVALLYISIPLAVLFGILTPEY